jgi:hypothetical protein
VITSAAPRTSRRRGAIDNEEQLMSQDWGHGIQESGATGGSENDPVEPAMDPDEGDSTGSGDGVEIGIGEGSTFEPEEDAGSTEI